MQRIYRFLFILAALSFGLTACEKELGSSDGITMPNLPMKPPPPPPTYDAHPAFTFSGYYNGIHNLGVSVSDFDGTDEVVIYLPADMPRAATRKDPGSYGDREWNASWSPSGNSISFAEGQGNNTDGWYGIRALDVSVGTDGKPVASNVRTICGFDQGTKVYDQAWSPVAADNRIAFSGITSTGSGIYLVSASGGTPTLIYSTSTGYIWDVGYKEVGGQVTWSPDGSLIAFVETNSTSLATIKIINTSGTVVATLEPNKFARIYHLEWSNAGANKLVFSGDLASEPETSADIYTIDPTAGSTATMLVDGTLACGSTSLYEVLVKPRWSPDNSEIVFWTEFWMYGGTGSCSLPRFKKVNVSTGVVTALSAELQTRHYGDWKTPN